MANDPSFRRLPLRQLLTHSEKETRKLADFVASEFHAKVSDLRDLSRPVRRRTHYPTLTALQNSLHNVEETGQEFLTMLEEYLEGLTIIRDLSNRDRVERLR